MTAAAHREDLALVRAWFKELAEHVRAVDLSLRLKLD